MIGIDARAGIDVSSPRPAKSSRNPPIASSVSRPRASNSTPSASNSGRSQPAPTPAINRPSLSQSIVASDFAVAATPR